MDVYALNYRVTPISDMCWQLQKLGKTKGGKPVWRGVDCYHHDLAHAVEELWERAAKDMPGAFCVCDRDELLGSLDGLKARFVGEVTGRWA